MGEKRCAGTVNGMLIADEIANGHRGERSSECYLQRRFGLIRSRPAPFQFVRDASARFQIGLTFSGSRSHLFFRAQRKVL